MTERSETRFVVHHHTGQGPDHWDLMLEDGDVLATWRLERPPSNANDEPIVAVRIFDHPMRFLTYQGLLTEGRGQVARFDVGTYQSLDRTPNAWTFELAGARLQGTFILERVDVPSDQPECWELRLSRRLE